MRLFEAMVVTSFCVQSIYTDPARINVMDESLNRVLLQFHTVQKFDVAELICVHSMTNIQLPLCKVLLLLNFNIEAHILM